MNRFLYRIDAPLFQALFHGSSYKHEWQNGRVSPHSRIYEYARRRESNIERNADGIIAESNSHKPRHLDTAADTHTRSRSAILNEITEMPVSRLRFLKGAARRSTF